jgi:FtsP/CotA-like multicopper oxidase with cupredoxin domain
MSWNRWYHIQLLSLFFVLLDGSCRVACTFYQPKEIVSENGKLDLTLTVRETTTLNGTRISAMFNDGPVGPTIRLKPGDLLTVTLENELMPESNRTRELMQYVMDPQNEIDNLVNVTIIYNRLDEVGNSGNPKYGYFGFNFQNLHFHGVGIPSSTEQLSKPLDGEEKTTFMYKIPENHHGGLYWYHNHVHALGTHGFLSGLFGIVIIEGHETDIRALPETENAKEILMIMSESLVDENKRPVPVFPIVSKYKWTPAHRCCIPNSSHV